jgi:hypothetical protein
LTELKNVQGSLAAVLKSICAGIKDMFFENRIVVLVNCGANMKNLSE